MGRPGGTLPCLVPSPPRPALTPKTAERLPTWELTDRRSQSPPFTKSLLFSISLLGKPPHSSIMSMATGKNLQSIPKKVGNVERCGPGPLLRNLGTKGAEPWETERGFGQNVPQPKGRWLYRAGKDPLPTRPTQFPKSLRSPGPGGPPQE